MSAQDNQPFGMAAIRYVMCHPVLANLLLITFLVIGGLSVRWLAVHHHQDEHKRMLSVRVEWKHASLVEVQDNLTVPLVNALISLGDLQSIESYSRQGESYIQLTLRAGADISQAFDEVRNHLTQLDLPGGIEAPIVIEESQQEALLRLILYSEDSENLRYWGAEAKRALLTDYLMDQVSINGLTDQELNVQIQLANLHRLQSPIATVSNALSDASKQRPMGQVETEAVVMSVGGEDKPRTSEALAQTTIYLQGQAYQLGDLADIAQLNDPQDPVLIYQNQPAVMLTINRQAHSGSSNRELVQRFYQWYQTVQGIWPTTIKSKVLWQDYQWIEKQVTGLLQCVVQGLVVAVAVMCCWLPWRLALWVGVNTAVIFLLGLAIMQLWQVSINAISLVVLWIMAGFVIQQVVLLVEYAWALWQRGEQPESSLMQTWTMLRSPVFASAAVLVGALAPLVSLPGVETTWLVVVPQTLTAIVLATLVAVIFIAPHQLMSALTLTTKRSQRNQSDDWRDTWRHRWHYWQFFALKKRLLQVAHHAWVVCAGWLVFLLMPWMLLMTGHLAYQPVAERVSEKIAFDVTFYAQTPREAMQQSMEVLEQGLRDTMAQRPWRKNRVRSVLTQYLMPVILPSTERVFSNGVMHHASMLVELDLPLSTSKRQKLQKQLLDTLPPNTVVEKINMSVVDDADASQTFDLVLQGNDWTSVTESARWFAAELQTYDGVEKVSDNMPPEMLTYKMMPTPSAVSLGLSKQYLAEQISDALNGSEVLINHQASGKKQTVYVQARPQHVDSEADLSSLPVHINGQLMVLSDVADWKLVQAPQLYYQYNGLPAVKLRISSKFSTASSTMLRYDIMTTARLALEKKFPVKLIDVAAKDEERSLKKTSASALIITFVLVYFVLAWCTGSYGWPMVLLVATCSGASAVLWGCLLVGMKVTPWTIISMLGLGSVLLPQMIVWQKQYRIQKKNNPKIAMTEAMVKGLCFQLRSTVLAMVVLSLVWAPLLLSQTAVLQSMRSIAAGFLLGWYLTTGCMFLGWPALTALYEQYAWRKRLNAN